MEDHVIRWLDDKAIAGHAAQHRQGDDHPMRRVTRRAAGVEAGGWDDGARDEVRHLFGALASEWHTRTSPERRQVVVDALDRGLAALGHAPAGLAVEPGSGTGAYSSELASRWDQAVAVELTPEMLRLAPPAPSARVLADASRLPLADDAANAIVLVNMFLFPDEVARVVAPDGVVVWVNSSGEQTPIHLPPEEVAAALPGQWGGVAARAGAGLWSVVQRTG
ncbi:MAG TPA: class I SAM-dependent methyltransferase [Acidimicrobiales bacterium]|nr:class I SAM-dependent methyltransferase [Acidimicrobiales bacterium]